MERWKVKMLDNRPKPKPLNPNNQLCDNCKHARKDPTGKTNNIRLCGKTLKITFPKIIGEDHCWEAGKNYVKPK